jgi:hypothetical protein
LKRILVCKFVAACYLRAHTSIGIAGIRLDAVGGGTAEHHSPGLLGGGGVDVAEGGESDVSTVQGTGAKQNKTKQNKTKQNKTNQSKPNQNKMQRANSQPAFKHVFNITKCS